MAHHILIRSAATQQMLACMPVYMKGHSYGEYVFDNSWANMASRMGHRYYVRTLCPKQPKQQLPFSTQGSKVVLEHMTPPAHDTGTPPVFVPA